MEEACPLAASLLAHSDNVVVSANKNVKPQSKLDAARKAKTARVLERGMFNGNVFLSFDVPNGVEKIGRRCLAESAIETVRLSQTVREVAADAFCSCKNLREVFLNDGLETVGDFAFARCALEELMVPGSVHFLGVGAFSCCFDLCWLQLAPGLREIGACCFEHT